MRRAARVRLAPAAAAAALAAGAAWLPFAAATAPARPPAAPAPAARPAWDTDRAATTFPRAWGAHPGAPLEWWYVTAILRDEGGRTRGVQWTLFRVALPTSPPHGVEPSAWRPGDLYFAHVAVSDSASGAFSTAERTGRTSVALAGADSTDLRAWIQDWRLERDAAGRFRVTGGTEAGRFDLTLRPSRDRPVAWGPAYVSAKSPDPRYRSRYQSDPALSAEGTWHPPGGGSLPVRGTAWFDHEWSDGAYDPAVVGWDWLGARLSDGRAVMLYRLRDAAGGAHHFFGGLVARDGRVTPLDAAQARLQPLRRWRSPRTGARYPVAWRVLLQPPGREPLTLDFEAAIDAAEWTTERSTGVTYWEGMVTGTSEQGGVRGRLEGFLELTGYAGGGVPGSVSSGAPTGR